MSFPMPGAARATASNGWTCAVSGSFSTGRCTGPSALLQTRIPENACIRGNDVFCLLNQEVRTLTRGKGSEQPAPSVGVLAKSRYIILQSHCLINSVQCSIKFSGRSDRDKQSLVWYDELSDLIFGKDRDASMNQKEVSELRRRFRSDRNAVSRIYGCYVNSGREIVSYLDESLGSHATGRGGKVSFTFEKVPVRYSGP